MSIVVFGSINIDLTTYGARLPKPGETVLGDHYSIDLGGKGCNQAVAVARLGGQTSLVGRVGRDSFGDTARAKLKESGLDTGNVLVDPESGTGIAVISVNKQAENCITVIGGANMAINNADVVRAKELFENAGILMLQLEIPLEIGLQAADIVRSQGGRVIFDPAPAPAAGLPADVLSRIDIITPNESETELLTGIRPTNPAQASEAAAQLRRQGVAMAVIKLGAAGVYYQNAECEGFIPAFKVNSIDSVAAGDCFNGGLAYALENGYSPDKAVQFAAACGALSTTKRGASTSAPRLADVMDLLQ